MTLSTRSENESLDLILASEIQAALLPTECPTDCPHQVAAARNRMVQAVGGDFYDFIRINEEQIVLLVGDVVGHGVRAAMVMARIMGCLHSSVDILARPRQTMIMLNRMLLDLGRRAGSVLPCSLFYTVIDAPTGASFFVNAGHPPPFICDHGRYVSLETGPVSLLLGVDEFDPDEGCHSFSPGERLVLYTDGVTDADNEEGVRFGKDRLHDVVASHAQESPARCVEAVFKAIDEFRGQGRQTDDETLIVVDRV